MTRRTGFGSSSTAFRSNNSIFTPRQPLRSATLTRRGTLLLAAPSILAARNATLRKRCFCSGRRGRERSQLYSDDARNHRRLSPSDLLERAGLNPNSCSLIHDRLCHGPFACWTATWVTLNMEEDKPRFRSNLPPLFFSHQPSLFGYHDLTRSG